MSNVRRLVKIRKIRELGREGFTSCETGSGKKTAPAEPIRRSFEDPECGPEIVIAPETSLLLDFFISELYNNIINVHYEKKKDLRRAADTINECRKLI